MNEVYSNNKCGGDSGKDTPVPMSNTEVKLLSADCSEGLPLVRLGRRHAIETIHFMDSLFYLVVTMMLLKHCSNFFYDLI